MPNFSIKLSTYNYPYNIRMARLHHLLLASLPSIEPEQLDGASAFRHVHRGVLRRPGAVGAQVHGALGGSASAQQLTRLALGLAFGFQLKVGAQVLNSTGEQVNTLVCEQLDQHAASLLDRVLVYEIFEIFRNCIGSVGFGHSVQDHS